MSFYEIITLSISAIALILSLYSSINTYYEKHIKTKIYIRWTSYFGHQLNMNLMISNMSIRPSALTSVVLHYGNYSIESSFHHARLTATNENTSWSDITPINVPARSAVNVILCFQYLNEFNYSDEIDVSYYLDGREIRRTEKLRNKLNAHQMAIALDYRVNHNI